MSKKKVDPDAPWSYVKFAREMAKAGWESLGDGVWRHTETKIRFGSFDFSQLSKERYGSGEMWTEYRIKHKTPVKGLW